MEHPVTQCNANNGATAPPRYRPHDWTRSRIVDSEPHEGYFRTRLLQACPWVAARVYLDWPLDDEGRLADRPRRLSCVVNGEFVPLHDWWLRLWPISEAEYQALLANPPADPWARVTRARRNADGN